MDAADAITNARIEALKLQLNLIRDRDIAFVTGIYPVTFGQGRSVPQCSYCRSESHGELNCRNCGAPTHGYQQVATNPDEQDQSHQGLRKYARQISN